MQPPLPLRSRPLGVSILASLHWLIAAFGLLLIGFAFMREPLLRGIVFAGIIVLLMALNIWIGLGLWQLKLGTYRLVLALNIISIVAQLIAYAQGTRGSPYGIFFDLGVILYLCHPRIRAVFALSPLRRY